MNRGAVGEGRTIGFGDSRAQILRFAETQRAARPGAQRRKETLYRDVTAIVAARNIIAAIVAGAFNDRFNVFIACFNGAPNIERAPIFAAAQPSGGRRPRARIFCAGVRSPRRFCSHPVSIDARA